jgi:hypothetical protein
MRWQLAPRLSQRCASGLLSALCLLSGCGIAPPERDYRAAVAVNTDAAYADYIAKYPTYPLAARLAFQLAERENTIEAYQRFQQAYPTSRDSDQAQFRLQRLQRQKAIASDFAAARASDLGQLLKRYSFDFDAWRAAIQMAKREWVALDPVLSQQVGSHLRPMLPTRAFGRIRGDLTSIRAGSTALCRGAEGDITGVYCEELLLDGRPMGPVVYDVLAGVYRMPPD